MLVNLTPHNVNILQKDGSFVTIEPTAPAARVTAVVTEKVWTGEYFHIAFSFGTVEGLPDQQPGIEYIVSKMCADAAPERTDLVYPADCIRDEQGRVIGCKALAGQPRISTAKKVSAIRLKAHRSTR